MSYVITRSADESYQILHRPVQGKDNPFLMGGPVYMSRLVVNGLTYRAFVFVSKDDGGYLFERRDYLTGESRPFSNAFYHPSSYKRYKTRGHAAARLRNIASLMQMRDLGDNSHTDFYCNFREYRAKCEHKCPAQGEHCDMLCGGYCIGSECRVPQNTTLLCREENCPAPENEGGMK